MENGKKSENNICGCSFIWYQQPKSKFDYLEIHFLPINLNIQHKFLKSNISLGMFIPASPRAANGRRPLAAPASVASVGAALCLKIHFFFHVNSYWGSSKFFHVRTFFVTDWAQKTSLTIYHVNSYWGSSKFFHVRDNFCPRLGTKNFPH